jgi:hypothetical protein
MRSRRVGAPVSVGAALLGLLISGFGLGWAIGGGQGRRA